MKSPKSSGKQKKLKVFILRRVVGKSMLPTLRPDRIVLATGLFHRLVPEQVVVVQHDGIEKIKRIKKIHAGRIFVVGDNINASIDSRSFGWLPLSSVIAKVIWPRP
jgi:phage repressor protein C with HTH and peptisase S24 domain